MTYHSKLWKPKCSLQEENKHIGFFWNMVFNSCCSGFYEVIISCFPGQLFNLTDKITFSFKRFGRLITYDVELRTSSVVYAIQCAFYQKLHVGENKNQYFSMYIKYWENLTCWIVQIRLNYFNQVWFFLPTIMTFHWYT